MFCTKCGHSLIEASKFCESCGEAVSVESSKSSWKSLSGGVLAALVFFIVYSISRYGTQEIITQVDSESKSQSIEEVLVQVSNETNKQLPMAVDSVTQLSATIASGKDLIYLYKLTGKDYDSLTQQDLENSLAEGIISGACTMTETKQMLTEGVRLVYRYSNEQGMYLGEIPVTTADCK